MSAADDVENWLHNHLTVTRIWGPNVRVTTDDGHSAVVAAVVEWLDGFDVYVATAVMEMSNRTISFTSIVDDRGNRYTLTGGAGSGGGRRARWLTSFEPALDPLATEIRLFGPGEEENSDVAPIAVVPIPERD